MSAPVVANGTIYVADYTEDRTLTARNLTTGGKRWQSPIPHGQVGTAPAVADGRVVHQSFGMIHAFDQDGGAELWRYDPGSGAPGAPVIANDTVYATNDSYQSDPATVMGVSTSDGTERWQSSVAGERASSPAYRNGTVFVGSSDGFVVALDARDGTERWRFDAEAGVTRALSAAEGTVYAADHAGNLYGLNAETGESRWQTMLSEGASPSTPAVADDTAYVSTETGVFAVSTDDGGTDWEFSTDGRAGTPTTDTDTVYFGGTDWDDHSVHALDAESGRERWSSRTDPREEGDHTVVGVAGPPVPVEEQLLVVAADGLSLFGSA